MAQINDAIPVIRVNFGFAALIFVSFATGRERGVAGSENRQATCVGSLEIAR